MLPDHITRRDFLNTTLLGAGAVLLGAPAPARALDALRSAVGGAAPPDPWSGYGGIGDYANANGNTWPVLEAAHRIREGMYGVLPANTVDTGETYDLIVVGGGIAGLAAAFTFARATGGAKRCLVLENHPIFGGEARQNEVIVRGVRLVAPQGSNQFAVPRAGSGSVADDFWTALGLPRDFEYAELPPDLRPLRVPLDNYAHMEGVAEAGVDVAYYFDERSGAPRPTWVRNIWGKALADAPFADEVKRDLLRWRDTSGENTPEFARMLDTMSYADYLEKTLRLRPEVTRMIAPVIGLINGASPDAVSAFAARQVGMPGVGRSRPANGPLPQSFPGGNATWARHLVRALVPDAIGGDGSFEQTLNQRVNFAALDRVGQRARIRVGATVVRVEHVSGAGGRSEVQVAYARGGRVYRTRARAVVMACPGFMNKLVVADLPETIRTAYATFVYAPALVVNVALTNWRFLYKREAGAFRWFDDEFGFSCNIRRPMLAGDHRPPLHPDEPTMLTFYMGFPTPGRSAAAQGSLGRAQLLGWRYADIEQHLMTKLQQLFADTGFAPEKDVAGVILNRWGHARVVQPPGWYFGSPGQPPAREIVQQGFDRLAIGHSELEGHQSVTGAIAQGKRAAEQLLASQ